MNKQLTVIALVVLLIAGAVLFSKNQPNQPTDPLQGTWRGSGEKADGWQWYLQYTFDEDRFEVETDSSYAESGTYKILGINDDGTISIEKNILTPNEKLYVIQIEPNEDFSSFVLDGLIMNKVQ